jgi:N-acetylglutamate synthase-like GNAT family acetyltransferase
MDGMKTGNRMLGNLAVCRVRRCMALPEHMRDGTREITGLSVTAGRRNEGLGTTLMHKVCREADEANIVLVLFPEPFGGGEMDQDRLMQWYADRFGFQIVQMAPEPLMARMPGATPRLLALNPLTLAAVTATLQ